MYKLVFEYKSEYYAKSMSVLNRLAYLNHKLQQKKIIR